MSSEMLPCPWALASGRSLINSELGNPIPCIPFPLIRGRGIMVSEGADRPFGLPPYCETVTKGASKRGFAPLYKIIPLPFLREGGKGGGSPDKY